MYQNSALLFLTHTHEIYFFHTCVSVFTASTPSVLVYWVTEFCTERKVSTVLVQCSSHICTNVRIIAMKDNLQECLEGVGRLEASTYLMSTHISNLVIAKAVECGEKYVGEEKKINEES